MFEDRPQARVQIAGTQQFCRTTHRQLKDHTDFDVIQSFIIEDHDLVGIVEQLKPDILVLHTQLVTPFCPECLKGLEGLKAPPHMVVVSPHHDPDLIMAQNCPVTRATLLSEMATSPLFIAVMESVADGFTYFAASPDAAEIYNLTPLEICVLRLMAVGFENTQLVTRLERKADSIYYTQRRIRLKLGVETNEQALVAAIRDGVVSVLGRPNDYPTANRAA
jgi:DNA-binding NarL/FixJ family response regulator